MSQQTELFSIADYVHLYYLPTSTRTKRPKGKTIAPLPKKTIALPTSTVNTNQGT